MRTLRYALLAAALTITAACGRDLTAPAGRSVAGGPFFTAIDTTADPDSVIGGYGSECPGPLECLMPNPCGQAPDKACYNTDPDDPEPGFGDSTSTGTTPPPAPKPSPTVPQDSVIGGYGSGSTGGLEYDDFEYDPETGTEYVATPDRDPDN